MNEFPKDKVQTSIEEGASDVDQQFVVKSLLQYNDANVASENARKLAVFSRRNGEIVGGLLGYTHWNWMFVKHLWVAEPFRRSGLGRNLMLAAEHEACACGCDHAHCDTFDFQALPFYQKLRYQIFGRLDDYPTDHVRYFLQKRQIR